MIQLQKSHGPGFHPDLCAVKPHGPCGGVKGFLIVLTIHIGKRLPVQPGVPLHGLANFKERQHQNRFLRGICREEGHSWAFAEVHVQSGEINHVGPRDHRDPIQSLTFGLRGQFCYTHIICLAVNLLTECQVQIAFARNHKIVTREPAFEARHMRKLSSFITGLILGGGLGAVAALLLAPGSGEGVRDRIREEIQEIVDAGRRAAEDRRDQLTEQLDALRENRPAQ